MSIINRNQTIVILVAVVVGLLLGQWKLISAHAGIFIIPLLMIMLYGLFLNLDFGRLSSAFLNLKFSLTTYVINFVFSPLFAFLLGSLFLQNDIPIWIGFVMLMVTPCTDWYLVFTGVAKGNVPLSASILPINLLLQVLLLPFYLMLFFGKTGNIEMSALIQSILLVLVIPFVLALLTKKVIASQKEKGLRFISFFANTQVSFLSLSVVAMFASEGDSVRNNPDVIYKLLIPVLIFFVILFLIGQLVSKLLKFNYADKVSLTMTIMARNSPIALAIAVTAFSSEPLIALSLVIGPLIELPILVFASQLLLKSCKIEG